MRARGWIASALGVALLGSMVVGCSDGPEEPAVGGDGDDVAATGDGFVDAEWFEGRQVEFLEAATVELDPGSVTNSIAHFERARRDESFDVDTTAVTVDSLSRSFEKIDGWEDTADFDLLYLTNLWMGYREELDPGLAQAIEDRLIGFKHWFTEPTPDGVVDQRWYWSENHRLIFHAIEYLAGQELPAETFTNDGRSGQEHRDHAEELIHRWMEEKARLGFVEWHSDVYYAKDVVALLTLIEWAEDDEIVTKASALLDLFLFDLALHTLDGNNGVTHGRSYMKDKSNAFDQDVFGTVKLLFDQTDAEYPSRTDAAAVLLSRAQRYRMPEVIRRVATSTEPMVDREHMGVPLDPHAPVTDDPEAPFGVDFDDENVDFWWDRGALTVWQVVPLTLRIAEQHDLWETDFFKPYEALVSLTGGDPRAAQELAQRLAPMVAAGLLSEVDTITYRTGDVMLSSAQDYRPGDFGEQYHAWQATLGERAVVFTTHPKEEPEVGTEWPDGDGYWTGTGSMPRSAQHGSAAIHIYRPSFAASAIPPLDAFGYLDRTHAYFPTEHFDEVVQEAGWTFGRKGDGYVALWSQRPTSWRAPQPGEFTNGLTEDFDLVAEGGPDNVWIVEVGDATNEGSFEEFRRAILDTEVEVSADGEGGAPRVRYDSPSQGEMTFGAEGPLVVDGEEVDLHHDLRFDNPWATVDFRGDEVLVSDGEVGLELDLAAWTRTVRG
jgi:hypothetical protein